MFARKKLRLYIKARTGGLFALALCGLLVFSCTTNKEKTAKTVPPGPYQYPKDTVWRGIPLLADNKELQQRQAPNYLDSVLLHAEQVASFSYPHGVSEDHLAQLKIIDKQQQLARIIYLRNLGVPVFTAKADKIKYLNLSNRNLVSIPPELGSLRNLKDLILKYNDIRHLTHQITHCRNLRRLDLTSNAISKIPHTIVYMTNLEELYLQDNRLKSLPANFGQMRNLKTLDLSNMYGSQGKGKNEFRYLPPSVCQLPKLERLLLERLPISTLPVNIVYLDQLKVLSVSGCYGLNLNNTFRILSKMKNLKVLDISFIGRSRLPNSIALLKDKLDVLIWQEEGTRNLAEIDRLRNIMPNTKIYSGAGGEVRPFLRGNSIKTILNAAY